MDSWGLRGLALTNAALLVVAVLAAATVEPAPRLPFVEAEVVVRDLPSPRPPALAPRRATTTGPPSTTSTTATSAAATTSAVAPPEVTRAVDVHRGSTSYVFDFGVASYDVTRRWRPSVTAVPDPGPSPVFDIELTLEPPKAGTWTEGSLVVHSSEGQVGKVLVDFGEGYADFVVDRSMVSGPYCTEPDDVTEAFPLRHAWRRPGTYDVTVYVFTAHCSQPGRVDVEFDASRRFTAKVATGVARSNGPRRPTVQGGPEGPGDGEQPASGGGFYATVRDGDGFLRSATITWGDGRVDRVIWGLAECRLFDAVTWPFDLTTIHARRRWTDAAWEAAGGTATLAVTTAGCDGSRPQTASTTVELAPRS